MDALEQALREFPCRFTYYRNGDKLRVTRAWRTSHYLTHILFTINEDGTFNYTQKCGPGRENIEAEFKNLSLDEAFALGATIG
jgi:hypothetical protein